MRNKLMGIILTIGVILNLSACGPNSDNISVKVEVPETEVEVIVEKPEVPETNVEVIVEKPEVPETEEIDGILPLHVEGAKLVDSFSNPVQLRGLSTHGLAWFPQYVSYESFKSLRDLLDINLIRLAMYTEEYGGYCNGGDREGLLKLVEDGVDYATQLGMYVIIDWHILQDGDPNENKEEAALFFDRMSKKYAKNTNVLYEICNEPNGNIHFLPKIRDYANEMIDIIRKNDEDAVILVGTPNWCSSIQEVNANSLEYENIMYTVHFYAASNTDELRGKVKMAVQLNVPVFISECSICKSDGSQEVDYVSGDKWMDMLYDNDISYVFWNISNKDETSAIFSPSCLKTSDYTKDDLSVTGRYFYELKDRY